jgi:spore coat protein CotH
MNSTVALQMQFYRSVLLTLCAFTFALGCSSEQGQRDAGTSGGTSGAPGTGGTGAGAGGASGGTGGSVAGGGGSVAGSGGSAPAGGTSGAGGSAAGSGGASAATAGSGGASAGSGGDAAGSGGASAGTAGSGAGSSGAPAVDLSVELYDPENLPRFDIDLPQASIDTLNLVTGSDDPRQDDYVTATLSYEGETVANIGLRIKGEGSFQPVARKPALKLKFDEYVPQQSFRGLRRLTLNNLFEDPSFIAERLAYDVYRAAGLPAPRCNSALVYINGTFYGVYANVESEDKTFLRRWFSDDDGNLYEEGQEDFVPGAETAFNLETNETANDRSDMIALIAAVQGATNPATFLTDIGGSIDTARFLRFTAVEAAVNQWDMYSYTVFWPNNFRMYHDPVSAKFHFIPWGHDMSMKPFRDSGKPFIRLFQPARQGDRSNGTVTAGLLLQRCLQSPGCEEAYRAAVEDVIEIYEGLDLEATATRYYNQVRASVLMDTKKNVCCSQPPALSNADFEEGYQEVLSTIRGRVAALRADLDE